MTSATNDRYTVKQTGAYAVVVTDTAGCQATALPLSISAVFRSDSIPYHRYAVRLVLRLCIERLPGRRHLRRSWCAEWVL